MSSALPFSITLSCNHAVLFCFKSTDIYSLICSYILCRGGVTNIIPPELRQAKCLPHRNQGRRRRTLMPGSWFNDLSKSVTHLFLMAWVYSVPPARHCTPRVGQSLMILCSLHSTLHNVRFCRT